MDMKSVREYVFISLKVCLCMKGVKNIISGLDILEKRSTSCYESNHNSTVNQPMTNVVS